MLIKPHTVGIQEGNAPPPVASLQTGRCHKCTQLLKQAESSTR